MAVQRKWDEVEQGMSDFVSELTNERLSAVLTYKTAGEKQFSNILWQTMQSHRMAGSIIQPIIVGRL
jgi:hypothetical protein